MATIAKFLKNNATNVVAKDRPFYLDQSRYPTVENVQEFNKRMEQLNTLKEEYFYYMIESEADPIHILTKSIDHSQQILGKKLQLEQNQQLQMAYTDRHRRPIKYEEE